MARRKPRRKVTDRPKSMKSKDEGKDKDVSVAGLPSSPDHNHSDESSCPKPNPYESVVVPEPEGEIKVPLSGDYQSAKNDDNPSPENPRSEEKCENREDEDVEVTTSAGGDNDSTEEAMSASVPSPSTEVPSTSAAMVTESSTSTSNCNDNDTTPASSCSSSSTAHNKNKNRCGEEEEKGAYASEFSQYVLGPGKKLPSREELIIRHNNKYLQDRIQSMMQRVQQIELATLATHISKQLSALLKFPGLDPAIKSSLNELNGNITQATSSKEKLTKQTLGEVQFAAKVMSNIIRQSTPPQLDLDDSATEESDSEDDELVLPDERYLGDVPPNAPYLPAENNPFLAAIKVGKEYETRAMSLDLGINECEMALTKSVALKRHCKSRKPGYALGNPRASSNITNVPVEATGSVNFFHERKPVTVTTRRVTDEIREQEEEMVEVSTVDGVSTADNKCEMANIFKKLVITKVNWSDDGLNKESPTSSQEETFEEAIDQTAPTLSLKPLDSDGMSLLSMEFESNDPDPNQSSSRCRAIKKPERNRKVIQVGGIQNMFRDPESLSSSVRCSCFGPDEICALCLGKAQKKSEINHSFMTDRREKLELLDETFHKKLSFSEDVPFEALLTSGCVEGNGAPLVSRSSYVQQLIKNRSQQFPPDFLETGPRPKRPKIYENMPYIEQPPVIEVPPKRDTAKVDRKKTASRKCQLSYDENVTGKGLGLPGRERKDSTRRARNQDFDIDNIVIPYCVAATTRVEQLVYKPIETPKWRVLDYDDIFASLNDQNDDVVVLDDMSNAAFLQRHHKCEMEEKKRFSHALQKVAAATRKTRGRSESEPVTSTTADFLEKPSTSSAAASQDAPNEVTVITEAMAAQALKSLFKVGRRRTSSTSSRPEEEEGTVSSTVEEVEPWPRRNFPLSDEEYQAMMMEKFEFQGAGVNIAYGEDLSGF